MKKQGEKKEWEKGGRLGNNRRQKRGRRRSSRVKRERAVIFATKGESQWISVRGGVAKRSGSESTFQPFDRQAIFFRAASFTVPRYGFSAEFTPEISGFLVGY